MTSPLTHLRACAPTLATAAAVAVVLTLTLAACGGGGGGGGGGVAVNTPQARVNLPAPNPSVAFNHRGSDEFNANSGLAMINADTAYQHGYWGQGATVAVLESGVNGTHMDLAANIVGGLALVVGPINTVTSSVTDDADGNGTYVAGIIGGVRDGSRFHGVAPSAKIMPLKFDTAGEGHAFVESYRGLFRHAAEANVHVLHNNLNAQINPEILGTYYGETVIQSVHTELPDLEVYLSSPYGAEMRAYSESLIAPLAGKDIAVVTPASGNGFRGGIQHVVSEFKSDGSTVIHMFTPEEIFHNFQITAIVSVRFGGGTSTTIALPSLRLYYPLTFTINGRRTIVRADPNSPGGIAIAPIYRPELRGRWLAVAAVNNSMSISRYSGGCGHKSKYWCLSAPGGADNTGGVDSGITSAVHNNNTGITNRAQSTGNETEAAAAHVSGALALLKSRFPNMPMSVLVHILLSTATDLGERGIDDVYGHGLLNVARAITLQGNASFVLPPLPTLAPQIPGFPAVALNPSDGVNYRRDEFTVNYGLGNINADAAYQRGYWGQGVTVAVVDSGVRGTHNNLRDNVISHLARRFDSSGRALADGALNDPFTVIRIDGNTRAIGSHGTEAAGVIAGVRGNANEAGVFIPYFYGHGVAPSTRILPLRFSGNTLATVNRIWGTLITFPLSGDEDAAFRYAISNNVQIINNSWGSGWTYFGHYGGNTGTTLAFEGPMLPPLWQVPGMLDSLRRNIETKSNIFRNEDVAVVWAAGNDGWNSETSARYVDTYEVPSYTQFWIQPRQRSSYTPTQLVNNFVAVEEFGGNRISITLSRNSHINVNGRAVTISAFEPDGVGDYALAPMLFPSLRGKWLAVVATDRNNRIAQFSNGCGSIAKYWCLAAPGVSIRTAYGREDDHARRVSGTSFSAPHVSGALALLKSRLQNMPMSVLIAILLSTATDLGDAGVDDVYGHGLVNVSAAITAQNGAQVVTRNSGVLLKDAKTQLPPSFAAFAQRAGEVRAAVRYLDGFYYDAPLKNLLQTNKAKNTPLNFAAEVFDIDNGGGDNPKQKQNGAFAFAEDGELREVGLRAGMFQVRHHWHSKPPLLPGGVGGVSTRPFYANDKGNSGEMRFNFGAHLAMFAARGKEDISRYRQFGLSWRRDFSQTGMALSFSRINEDDTLLGGKFGGAMPLTGGGRTTQTGIAAYYKLGASEIWRAYANYRRADINANLGGIVHKLSAARAEGWQLGISAQDWFSEGDAFRIGIGRDIALTGGKAILRYAKSSDPQTDANTQITHNRGYRTEERRIDISEDSPLSFSLGYGFKPNETSRLSFGANIRQDAPSAFSIDWRWNL